MKNLILAVLAAAALASAACKERKADPKPNYDGSRSASDRSHDSLDKEAGGY
ncbi:MAG: hypothetical protein M0D55_07500 [Elusimicrobiota bacterium]|nr:MAG: hypothetical protein M0D55_07500 [Elusimicrobiota bacterium]